MGSLKNVLSNQPKRERLEQINEIAPHSYLDFNKEKSQERTVNEETDQMIFEYPFSQSMARMNTNNENENITTDPTIMNNTQKNQQISGSKQIEQYLT